MELKHTPGPWFAEDDDWTDGEDALITCESREGMVSVAKVEGGGSESGYDSDFSEEQMANAKLIAAAPELLEALQDALYRLDVLISNGQEVYLDVLARDKSKSAIAKATGH